MGAFLYTAGVRTDQSSSSIIYMKGGGWVWRLGGTGGALKGVGGVIGRRYIEWQGPGGWGGAVLMRGV